LLAEFSALAILVASLFLLGERSPGESAEIHRYWLAVPAIASLIVFLSFIGLMYLRWVGASGGPARPVHKVVFVLLALTLVSLWAIGIAQTWSGLQAAA